MGPFFTSTASSSEGRVAHTMDIDHDITSAVRHSIRLPAERYSVIRRFDELELSRLRRAVLLLFAGWNPLSPVSLLIVSRAIESLSSEGVELYVIDCDCVPDTFAIATFGRASAGCGSGEVAWVRDGAIVATFDAGSPPRLESEVLRHTRELLDIPAA